MQFQDVANIQPCQLVSAIRGTHRYEMCDLCKMVNNHPYRVISFWGYGESIDEIHAYVLPFALGYG
jgi:hypothetical protein